jgi:hypothetical protein
METTIIDDLIILGRACPEETKSGRVTVCTAGYSHKLGFVRVYPTTPKTKWRQWDVVEVPVEIPPQDTRHESWKIRGSKKEWSQLHKKVKIIDHYPRSRRMSLISSLADESIAAINEARRSLGIIRPEILDYWWEKEDDVPVQLKLLEQDFKTKNDYAFTARIRYRCQSCAAKAPHNQQILEWGFYEWLRKNPQEKDQVWENAKFSSEKHSKFFLVGNQFLHRTSFLVITVLRLPGQAASLPLVSPTKVTYRDDISPEPEELESSKQLPLM